MLKFILKLFNICSWKLNDNCIHLFNKQKIINMARIKTETNKRKAGRPQGEPTSVVSLRIPTKLKEELVERFGKNWQLLFKDFCRVYLTT